MTTILGGVVHDNKGAMTSILTGMITWSAGAILLGWSIYMVSVMDIPYVLLLFGIILWAHGRTYAFITGMVTLVHTTSPQYRPVASTYSEVSLGVGMLLYVLIYNTFFHNGHVLDPEHQNLLGFFAMQILVAVIVAVISIFGLSGCSNNSDQQSSVECQENSKSVSQCDQNTKIDESILTVKSTIPGFNVADYGSTTKSELSSDLKSLVMDETNSCISDLGFGKGETDINGKQTLWSIMLGMDFLLYLVTMVIVSANKLFFLLHISIIARCLGFSIHESTLITIFRATAVMGLLSVLVLLFCKKGYLPFWLLQIGCLLSLSGYLCMTFSTTQLWTLYFSAAVQGLGYGLINSILPGFVEHFSSKHLATLFGIVETSIVALLLILQPIFAALYSAQIPEDSGSNYCYGPACLQITIWILDSLAVICNCTCLVLMIRKSRQRGSARNVLCSEDITDGFSCNDSWQNDL